MPFATYQSMDVPIWGAGLALRSPYGIIQLPPGSKVAAYVRSTAMQSDEDPLVVANHVTTLAAGLARVRAGLGDTVIVLPGHTESVADATMLDNMSAGTRVIGIGRGSNMPVFRWTATGSQWVMNDADVTFQGLRLRLEGANGVVKAIVCTAADCGIYGCDIEVASGATAKATIAVEIGAAAHRFNFCGNVVRGTATHNVTNCVLNAGVASGIRICNNEMIASATAGNGLVNIQAASLGIVIADNFIVNTHTNSTSGITLGAAASSGVIARNYIGILAASTTTDGTAGIIIGATSICNLFENRCSDGLNNGSALPAVAS